MATTVKIIGYRFHISYFCTSTSRRYNDCSPYPGYPTREECEEAALRCKHFVEDKRDAIGVQLRFETTTTREKGAQ